MRRLVIVIACLFGVGALLLLLLRARSRRWDGDDARDRRPEQSVPEPPAAAVTGPEPEPAVHSGAEPVPADQRRALHELAEIRADMAERVSRRTLFLMAQERGIPCDLFVASQWDLLDAILRAEDLRPEDRDISPKTRQRLLDLADEAYRREQLERQDTLEQHEKHSRLWRRSTA